MLLNRTTGIEIHETIFYLTLAFTKSTCFVTAQGKSGFKAIFFTSRWAVLSKN